MARSPQHVPRLSILILCAHVDSNSPVTIPFGAILVRPQGCIIGAAFEFLPAHHASTDIFWSTRHCCSSCGCRPARPPPPASKPPPHHPFPRTQPNPAL